MIDVLYRDDALVVVDKPSGLVTHPTDMAKGAPSAMEAARAVVGRHVFPVHRLDRGTSGVLVFALDAGAASALGERFRAGEVEKRYVAIARGVVPPSALVDHPIPRGEGKERVPAVTALERLFGAEGDKTSLVLARPETGRFHQVRRHLSHLRHPIAGDTNYGTGWFNRWMRSEIGLPRLALHALEIDFPWQGGRLVVRAPLAADMAGAASRLGVPSEVLAPLVQRITAT